MSDVTCICGQPAPDATICVACVNRLRNALEQVGNLWPEVEVRLTGEKAVNYATMGTSPSRDVPMPFDLKASDLRDDVRVKVVGWVRVLLEEGGTYDGPDEVSRLAEWLRAQVTEIARAGWAIDCLSEITDAVNQMTRLIDNPPPRIYAGRCSFIGAIGPDGTPGDPDPEWLPCFSEMWVLEDDRRLATTVRCPVCGATFSLAIRREWVLQQYAGYLVTPTEGAALMGIPRNTINQWATRKRVLPRSADGTYSTDASERRIYLLDDLMELARPKREDAA